MIGTMMTDSGAGVLVTATSGDGPSCCGRVLIVDDEVNMQVVLSEAFEDEGHSVSAASNGAEAIAAIAAHDFDILILDLKLPDMTGIDVFRRAREIRPGILAIMITAYSSIDTAITAMKMGAYDYITKPFNVEKLLMVAGNAIEGTILSRAGRLHGPNGAVNGTVDGAADTDAAAGASAPAPAREGWMLSWADPAAEDQEFGGVVGSSPKMKQLLDISRNIAPTNATVLIYGESGTGKELVASYIHKKSLRSRKPFIRVSCAAIPETLLESELFGHEKGAFTHAISRRLGRFELAHTGTIFLDEVGEMSPAMQAKLLRVLQEKEFERVGGAETIKVDVRVLAATNQNLKQAVVEGSFREDLYYRLSVVPLFLPPLRERKQDIAALASRFIDKYNKEFGKAISGITSEALEHLAFYNWPGNIRELENAIERAVLLARRDALMPSDFHLGADPAHFISLGINTQRGHDVAVGVCEGLGDAGGPGRPSGWGGLGDSRNSGGDDEECAMSLEELECRYIKQVLEQCDDNRTHAARVLKITRRTLLNKIKKYDL